ncbi:MAG: hypothetical protein ACOY3X_13570 [Pseudomonadota bacterium]
MERKKKSASSSHRARVGKLYSSAVAQTACAELGTFWRPEVDGAPGIYNADDFPAINLLFQLDAELRLFAKRKTFRLTTIRRNIKNSKKSPKPPKGPVEKILDILPDVLSALYPGVVYSPYINEFFVLALKYGFVGKDGVADRIMGMGLLADKLEEEKSNFLAELLGIYHSEKFSKTVYAAYRKCDICEKSLASLIRSFQAIGEKGARVFCVDLYLARASSVTEDVSNLRARNPDSYIPNLLSARRRFAKKTLNYGHPILGQSLWLMVPSVGAYGEPAITAWFIVDGGVQAPSYFIRGEIAKEWARAAGSSAYCRDLNVKLDPLKAVDTNEFSIGNKKSSSQAGKCLSYLANKSYFIFPDLPEGSDSFWRSERMFASGEKKTTRSLPMNPGEYPVSREARKEVRRKSKELENEIRKIEKIMNPRKEIGSIPAADTQPEDYQEFLLHQAHSTLLVEKARVDDQEALLKVADRRLKAAKGRERIPTVISSHSESHQQDVPGASVGVPPVVPDPHSGAPETPSESAGEELLRTSNRSLIEAAIDRHRVQMGSQPLGERHRSDSAHEKAPSITLVGTKTATERHIVQIKADAKKGAIGRIFGGVESDKDDPSSDA